MKRLLLITLVTVTALFLTLVAYAQWPISDIPPVNEVALAPIQKTMRPFRSEQELANYFRELAEKQKREQPQANMAFDAAQPSTVTNIAKAKSGANKEE